VRVPLLCRSEVAIKKRAVQPEDAIPRSGDVAAELCAMQTCDAHVATR
jgi:hypothetical protein